MSWKPVLWRWWQADFVEILSNERNYESNRGIWPLPVQSIEPREIESCSRIEWRPSGPGDHRVLDISCSSSAGNTDVGWENRIRLLKQRLVYRLIDVGENEMCNYLDNKKQERTICFWRHQFKHREKSWTDFP